MSLIAKLITKVGLRYLFPAVLLIGLAAGGWIGWKLQAGRIASAKADIAELEGWIETGRLAAAASAAHAEHIIGALQTDLAQAWRMREVERVEVIREIKSASSPDRVCLGPDARRVLHGTARRGVAESEGIREGPGPAAGPAADPGRPAGASEQAVSLWMEAALHQWERARKQVATQADIIRSLPCVEIVP